MQCPIGMERVPSAERLGGQAEVPEEEGAADGGADKEPGRGWDEMVDTRYKINQ